MTTPAEKGLSLLETPGIITSEPINRDHWASLLRANGALVGKMRRMDWDPCPSCLKTIDEEVDRNGERLYQFRLRSMSKRLSGTNGVSLDLA